jgi:hypothetical protein
LTYLRREALTYYASGIAGDHGEVRNVSRYDGAGADYRAHADS